MFRTNAKHEQGSMFGLQSTLSPRQKKRLEDSSYNFFYKTIFCNIKEGDFSVLYSAKASRPNAPINCMVAALILKQKYNWTYEELFDQIDFNILAKTALGLGSIDNSPFNQATLFNFQNRLLNYYTETNVNLLEQVFDNLTADQIKELRIKTDIQRTDSFMAASNIRSYGRLQLLVEVLLRLWKILDKADKALYLQEFSAYSGQSSGQYIHKLKASDLPGEIEEIARIYHFSKLHIMPKYRNSVLNEIFERVYTEHFTVVEEKIEVRPSGELNSSCLQSPDDMDATYRKKRDQEYRGQSINVVETASKDNPVNLITDVAVNPNNVDDAQVLNQRTDKILEKTPDLCELHTDGAYSSPAIDLKFEEENITQIQTAVRGKQCKVDFEIKEAGKNKYSVSCPNQMIASQETPTRYKANFDGDKCKHCPLAGQCPVAKDKPYFVYYFTYADFLRNKRLRAMLSIDEEKRKTRANVEATVHEFTCRMTNRKVKVRGAFKTSMFAFTTAIMINFGRIYRYHGRKTVPNVPVMQEIAWFSSNFVKTFKWRQGFFRKIRNLWKKQEIFLNLLHQNVI